MLEEERRPIVVGGAGLYLRAALADLDLRPPRPAEIRATVEAEIRARGPAVFHAELPARLAAAGVEPSDRKRIARLTELIRAGIEPHTGGEPLWTARLRHPTRLFGLAMDREELGRHISDRVDRMLADGAAEEARAVAEAGASRTARAALGFEQLLEGHDAAPSDEAVEAVNAAHRSYARRQLTWMRRMEDVTVIERDGKSDEQVAGEIAELLGLASQGRHRARDG